MTSSARLILNPAILRELTYRGRHAWVAAKEVLGLPRRGDQTFYIERFARLLKSGAIGPACKIMATGRNDGAGSQAQAAMSAVCFALAHGLEYIHRPFTSVEHAETDMSTWVRQCEDYFNIGHGSRRIGECSSPVVAVDRVLKDPRAWSDDVIVEAPHYLHYCNQDLDAWERALPILHRKYRANKAAREPGVFTVAAHLRRGDVSLASAKFAKAFTPDAVFLRTLEAVTALLSKRVGDFRIRIFSQGDAGLFEDFRRFGCELCLDQPALSTHSQLADADVLIMSQGSFSYTAAVLNEGITLYDPQKYRPLRDWIVRTPGGQFDAARFSQRLDAQVSARGRPT